MTFSTLKSKAKSNLSGNWGVVIAASLTVGALQNLSLLDYVNHSVGTIAVLASFLASPITVGYSRFHYHMTLGKNADFSDIFSVFNGIEYGRILGSLLLQSIYIVFWMFLFIIPGFVKAFSYSMTTFILQDPDYSHLSADEAITKSREMMDGHKADLFMLGLSFIGWMILVILTLGLLGLYVSPYITQTTSEFYLELKGRKVEKAEKVIPDWVENY